ncbi:MAG TPA: DNA primase [Nitrosopumilaceae archaeon]|nr:DNA primase [Nitrosopumilaceae archaeon]
MIQLGIRDLVKYPFLAETGEYLRDKGFNLEQLGHPDWQPIVEKAYGRIVVATTGQIYGSSTQDFENMDSEILSFVIAIVLLKSAGITTLIKRFSLAEARRAERYLQQDLQKKNETKLELPLKIMQDLFSVKVMTKDEDFVISVSDYLKRAVQFHEKEWKLINRRVEGGFVFLTAHETVRLIRKELDGYINSKIQAVDIPSIPETFRKHVYDLVLLAKKFSEYVTVSTDYPPCIKHAINVLDQGENLPHSGRFMLATYLLSKGQTIDQIVPLFKNAPDYNERVTRYQLEHIAGSFGKGTKYSCPSCDKLRSENLCFEIPECNGIINPIQFGKKRTANA